MDYCTQNCISLNSDFDYGKTCEFVKANCDQDTVQFIQFYFCLFKNSFMVLITLGLAIVLVLFEALSYISNHYLAPCVDNLMKSFNFSQTLAGVTFLAFANGAPDVLTAIIAGNSSSQQTALIPFGSVFGAAIFACGIILARVIVYSPGAHDNGLKVHRGQTIKPIMFYIIATLFLVIVSAAYKKMTWYIASVYLLMYVLYGGMVMVDQKRKRRQLRMIMSEQSNTKPNRSSLIVSQSEHHKEQLLRKVSKPMQAINFGVEAALLDDKDDNEQQVEKVSQVTTIVRWSRTFLKYFFQYTVPAFDMQKYTFLKFSIQMTISTALILYSQNMITNTINRFPIWVIAQAVVFVVLGALFLTCRTKTPKISWPFELYSFIVCIIWISYLVSVLINMFQLIQVVTGINPVFIGMTFLACGNSIGDYFSIVSFAKKGKGMTAIAGIYSGQLFNLLIGLGVSYMIKGISKGTFKFQLFPSNSTLTNTFDDAIIWTVILGTLVLLVVSLVYLRRSSYVFSTKFAKALLLFYLGFMLVVSVFAILSDVFGEISCDLQSMFS